METAWRLLKKLTVIVPCDPAIPPIYPKNTKTLISKSRGSPMFTTTLFTIGVIWKQPKYPSMDEWVKMCYVYTHTNGILLRHIKDEIFSFATTRMALEHIMLSENVMLGRVS